MPHVRSNRPTVAAKLGQRQRERDPYQNVEFENDTECMLDDSLLRALRPHTATNSSSV